jgi:uncharacterized membrane protein YccC
VKPGTTIERDSVGEMNRQAIVDWLGRHATELRLALRTTLAGLITFVLAHLLQLQQGYWAVLTSVIIMQASLGGSLKAVLDRLVGTLAGSFWGVAVSLAIPHRGLLSLGVMLALALGPLALAAALRPSYRIAPVTAIIVLLSTASAQEGPVAYAFDRVLEIALGSLVGFAVSLLILPARAHGLLANAAAETLRDFGELLQVLLQDLAQAPDRAAVLAIFERVRKSIASAEALAEEAKRERANRLTDAPDAEPVARNLRRLRHDLTAISRAVTAPLPQPAAARLSDAARALGQAMGGFLAAAAAALAGGKPPPSLEGVDAALAAFQESLTALRQSSALPNLSVDAVSRIFGLVFALQQMRENFAELSERIAERLPTVGLNAPLR